MVQGTAAAAAEGRAKAAAAAPPTDDGAAAAAGNQSASLPDDLLAAILLLAGKEQGAATSAVCRRWRRIAFSQPSWWRQLTLDGGCLRGMSREDTTRWVRGQRALLARVAQHAEHVVLRGGGAFLKLSNQGELAQLLCALCPARLAALQLDYAYKAELAALQRFIALTSLHVEGRTTPRPCFPAQLSALRSLVLRMGHLEGPAAHGMAASIGRLTALTSLRLACFGSVLDKLGRLSRLQQLHSLALRDSCGQGVQLEEVQRALARLPRLASFHHAVWGLGGIQAGLITLEAYGYRIGPLEPPAGMAVGRCAAVELCINSGRHIVLPPLLDAAAPSGAQLTCLQLDSCTLQADALRGCSQLAGLRELELTNCRMTRLPADLAAAASLTRLLLHCRPWHTLSETDVSGVLARLPRLRVLGLQGGEATEPAVLRLLCSSLPHLELEVFLW